MTDRPAPLMVRLPCLAHDYYHDARSACPGGRLVETVPIRWCKSHEAEVTIFQTGCWKWEMFAADGLCDIGWIHILPEEAE